MKLQYSIPDKTETKRILNPIVNKKIILEKNIIKTNESHSSMNVLRLYPAISSRFIIKKSKFNSDSTNLYKVNTEGDHKNSKAMHQPSQSLQYLPAITQITPKKKLQLFTYNTVDKIKRVENVFKTEMRIRESIIRSILNKSIDLMDEKVCKNFYSNGSENTPEDNINNNSNNLDPESIVKEINSSIKKIHSPYDIDYKNPPNDVKINKKKKNDPLKLIRRKSDYNVINGKISFPSIVSDNELMCRIFKENMCHMNEKIFNYDSYHKQQKYYTKSE